jgi:F0F1-type ATP synthase assembly protein I
MKRAAAKKKTTTVDDDLQRLAETQAAKTQFVGATVNLSWRLALTVLIPLLGGIAIDNKFDTSPSFTLAGLMIAVVLACMAIWQTVQEVNKEQAEAESKNNKRSKSV